MGSRALSSSFGKRLMKKGIDNIPNMFKFGLSKKVADMVAEEAQKTVANKCNSLF